jgi:threonine dehydrogenase-like Zn-dependent dehydrogenase
VRNRQMIFTGGRLEQWRRDVDAPRPGEVLLRTEIAGVCGTDAHRLDGDLPDPGMPVCFGHEGIGRIEALGDGVTHDHGGAPVGVGDLVYWTPSGTTVGTVPPMGWPPPADVPNPAAFQDHPTLAPGNVFCRIPDDTPPEAVIAFGCAMPTALGGMARLGGVRNGQTVVVQGCGPVGLSATLLASLTLARDVIVIGAPDDRLRAAETLGATATLPLLSTTAEERRAFVLERTRGRGADVVIEAAGRMPAFAEGMALLAPEGRYLVLGLYSGHGTVAFDPIRLNNLSQSVIGSMGPTSLDDLRTTVQLAQRHGARLRLADLVTHRFGLDDLASAIRVARSGEAIKAIVVPALDRAETDRA